jgi:glycosyltransferase involved in cell wall biosynthesis
VPPGDVAGLAEAIGALLGDRDALEAARAGAARARDELTWDRSAAAHLDLYRELV